MSAQTVGEYLLVRLREWGVQRVYGYPGDGSNGLNLAFHADDTPEFIQTRHEELAAFAACADAKLTGEVAVCMATSGPGAIHLLNGLYDAKLDHVPCWRSSASSSGCRSVAAFSRRSTWRRCSRMSRRSSCRSA